MEVFINLVGIFAPASPVGQVELNLNLEFLAANGVELVVHPQVRMQDGFFAGSDEDRAQAFIEMAYSPAVNVMYGARGGYGCSRLLPYLAQAQKKKGKPPKKTILGYSDMSALFSFLGPKWGWTCIHAPMPSLNRLSHLIEGPQEELLMILRGESKKPTHEYRLKRLAGRLPKDLVAPMVGGNLSILSSQLGTPYFQKISKPSILFIEDVSEAMYRIDRMMVQLVQSGELKRVKAIVLGTFFECHDRSPKVLVEPVGTETQPLRPVLSDDAALCRIFNWVQKTLKIPVFKGLDVGHGMEKGQGQNLLWMGSKYRLKSSGRLIAE